MQLISTVDESALDVLMSFDVEGCMLLVTMICFKLLHQRWTESLKPSKVSCSASDVLAQHAVRANKSVDHQATAKQSAESGFSEMILECGQARDVDRARKLWGEATATQTPDGATLESMVEVLVTCKHTKEAWAITKDFWEKQNLQTNHHAVRVYSALLRGLSKGKKHEQVCTLYLEMQERMVPMNTITYNVVLNSLLHVGKMDHVPALLDAMRAEGKRVAPDVVTFSTIIKGYCNIGDVDSALEVLDLMIDQNIKPDLYTFNGLLDGCAKSRRLKDALRLLELMKDQGVPPSNSTLSIAIKVLGRAHRLSQAFQLAESLSKEHGFQLNIQVYTCLMQACFHSRRIRKAIDLYNRIVEEGLAHADEKTYTVLVSGCLNCGVLDKAVLILRAAYHLPQTGMILVQEGKPQGVAKECVQELLAGLKKQDPAEEEMLKAELWLRSRRPC